MTDKYYRNYDRMGRLMQGALLFARTYKGWHTFDHLAKQTKEPIKRLAKRGFVEINEFNQFRAV
jgi:hypothetical protein